MQAVVPRLDQIAGPQGLDRHLVIGHRDPRAPGKAGNPGVFLVQQFRRNEGAAIRHRVVAAEDTQPAGRGQRTLRLFIAQPVKRGVELKAGVGGIPRRQPGLVVKGGQVDKVVVAAVRVADALGRVEIGDRVRRAVRDEHVRIQAAGQRIGARTTVQGVPARAAQQSIAPGAAKQGIVPRTAVNQIVPGFAQKEIVAGTAIDQVMVGTACKRIVSGIA